MEVALAIAAGLGWGLAVGLLVALMVALAWRKEEPPPLITEHKTAPEAETYPFGRRA